MQGFPAWAQRHCTVFGLFESRQMEMVASWQAVFDACGWTADELHAATTWLASHSPPRFPSEHLAALQHRLREARSEESADDYAARVWAERRAEAEAEARARERGPISIKALPQAGKEGG
jgi:hypothetical protein